MDHTTDFQDRLPRTAVSPWPGFHLAVRSVLRVRVLLFGLLAVAFLRVGDVALEKACGSAAREARSISDRMPPDVREVAFMPLALSSRTLLWLRERTGWTETLALLIGLVWCSMVSGVCGGAIVRSVVVRHATGKSLSLKESLEFSVRRAIQTGLAPLVVVLVFGLLWACRSGLQSAVALVAVPYIGPFLWVVSSIVATCLLAVGGGLLVLSAVSWPLMVAGSAVEDLDCLDSLSRAFHFVLSRPFLYAAHVLCGAVLVALVAFPLQWCLSAMSGANSVWSMRGLLPAGVSATVFFAWSAISFLRLRERVDSIETDEIALTGAALERLPEVPLAGRAAHPVEEVAA